MNKLFRSLSAVTAGAVALVFASATHAQIVTFNTIVANTGGTNVNFVNGNVALSQTFTNVAELNNLTYEFVENGRRYDGPDDQRLPGAVGYRK